ncbi:MAG: DUF1565 domain-containing protein, partial [Deltaproteobacteria bacterium]|nr:DUF1565 domain-containing protein [Deltaproteobacteria bacterium]
MSLSRAVIVLALICAALASGCGGDETAPAGGTAGTLGLDDGTCQPAGIPPEMCAAGFEPDGKQGCEPILPPKPCPKGQMAVPGEASCRPVMPCPPGKWGELPVDEATEHVDGSYAGGDSDGSAAKPWTTIGEAVKAAAPGALVAVAAGTYTEDVLIKGKAVRLWGVCSEKVTIAGTEAEFAAVYIWKGASGSGLGALAVTGG